MRYQKIESKIWNDEKFTTLTPMQQRLFFYILTCPHNNLTGLYVLKMGYAAEDLKCLPKDFEKDLGKLIEKGLIEYDYKTSVLLIKNFLKHNPITNPNQKKAVVKQLEDLPKSSLILSFINLYPDLCEGLPKGLREGLLKPETETETETETEVSNNASPEKPVMPISYFFSCQFFEVDSDYRKKLGSEYPILSDELLVTELSKMEDWLADNRQKKKFTAKGKLKNPKLFIKNWLNKVELKPEGKPKKNIPSTPWGFDGEPEWMKKRFGDS